MWPASCWPRDSAGPRFSPFNRVFHRSVSRCYGRGRRAELVVDAEAHDVHVETAVLVSDHDFFTHLFHPVQPPIRRLKLHPPLLPLELVGEELDARRPAAPAKRAPSATTITGAITATERAPRAERPFDSAADHKAGSRLPVLLYRELTILVLVKHVHVEPHA